MKLSIIESHWTSEEIEHGDNGGRSEYLLEDYEVSSAEDVIDALQSELFGIGHFERSNGDFYFMDSSIDINTGVTTNTSFHIDGASEEQLQQIEDALIGV